MSYLVLTHIFIWIEPEDLELPNGTTLVKLLSILKLQAQWEFRLEVAGCTVVYYDPETIPSTEKVAAEAAIENAVLIALHPKKILDEASGIYTVLYWRNEHSICLIF